LSGALAGQGCRGDTTIGVVAANHPLTALVWLAAARAGTIVSLINFMLKADELAVLLENLDPVLLFSDAAHLEVCEVAIARAGIGTRLVLLDEAAGSRSLIWQRCWRAPRHAGPHPTPADLFEISYTSGTTSAPKGGRAHP